MAKRQARYEQVYLQHNLDNWFKDRQRVFVYHYINQPKTDPQWQNLAPTGCQYRGWTVLSNFHRGEIWTYPTQKHLMLVQMLVTRDMLIMGADWKRLMKESRQKDRQWQQEIRHLMKKHSETYTWWGEEK